MKALYIILITLNVLAVMKLYLLKNFLFQEWQKLKPIRLDKENSFYDTDIYDYHNEIIELCEILSIEVPKTYLVGNMGFFNSNAQKGYIIYKKNPIVFVYYKDDNKAAFTVAHEMYHAYQRAQYPERFTKKGILDEWIEQSELEAQAFAVAYMESIYPDIKVAPREWEHSVISEDITNNRNEKGEIVVIRTMADEFKKIFFSNEELG